MLAGKWVSTPAGSIWVPHGWHLFIPPPRIGNIRGKDPRKFAQYTIFLNPPRDPRRIPGWRRKKSKSKYRTVTHYFAPFSRYREKDLDRGTFIRGRRDVQIKDHTVLGHVKLVQNGKIVRTQDVFSTGTVSPTLNIQKTWDQENPGPPYHGGGPFRSIEVHLPASKLSGTGTFNNIGNLSNPANTYGVYEGSFVDDGTWLVGESYANYAAKGFANFTTLSSYHTAAWDQTKPKLPKAGLAQFIYELKDLPGQLATSANAFHKQWVDLTAGFGNRGVMLPYMHPKEAADHFLNHEFGWKPFLSDIAKLYDAWNNSVDYISRITRDNGQWVRKRRVLEASDTTTAPIYMAASGTMPTQGLFDPNSNFMCKTVSFPGLGNVQGFCSFTDRSIKKVWAVGSFKYYRPEFDSALFDGNSFDLLLSAQRLMTLYGLRINPTLLWKITPWTWLIDWTTGLGNHIERLDDFVQDGIVSRYLYVMNQEEHLLTKTSVLNFFSGPLAINWQRRYTLKQREVADSPYGFNAPWNVLSPRQLAILGAIGFTRSSSGYISRGA